MAGAACASGGAGVTGSGRLHHFGPAAFPWSTVLPYDDLSSLD
ncbi:hypothetical protein [Streptomyces sp. NPDC088733]